MAVNDPATFPQKYVDWANTSRISLSKYQGVSGIFAPAVDPYDWLSRTEYFAGSPEGQAFTVNLYTVYSVYCLQRLCRCEHLPVNDITDYGSLDAWHWTD